MCYLRPVYLTSSCSCFPHARLVNRLWVRLLVSICAAHSQKKLGHCLKKNENRLKYCLPGTAAGMQERSEHVCNKKVEMSTCRGTAEGEGPRLPEQLTELQTAVRYLGSHTAFYIATSFRNLGRSSWVEDACIDSIASSTANTG